MDNNVIEKESNTISLSADKLNEISLNATKERREKNIERIRIGREDAINHITQGCEGQMLESANKGLTKTYIYSFKWTEDPKDTHDVNGNKTVFEGNVRLLDLINKGIHDFLKDLNSYFNKESENKYYCGVNRFREKDGTTSWNIYVSWGTKENKFNYDQRDNYQNPRHNTRGRGGRGGGYRRDYENKPCQSDRSTNL
jgi:hypothetical protein